MSDRNSALPVVTDVGTLGIFRLKRMWFRADAARLGKPFAKDRQEFDLDHVVLDAIGLGLEQTMQYLAHLRPTFEEFENWIVATTGGVAPNQIARINAAVTGSDSPDPVRRRLAAIEAADPVLSGDDLAFWDEHGYVVLKDAVPAATRDAATAAICGHIGVRLDDPESWYHRENRRAGIMVQYFQHPAFTANRQSPRIRKAFAQLWDTPDLWVTTDRVGFNVPERPEFLFQGPDLHWDLDLQAPIGLGMQGILYLTDTPPEQGAFTCVPGFHRRIADWLVDLPKDRDPNQEDLHGLGSVPIAGKAGDMVIWHHALPHGSRPNRGARPRIVQYITMYPTPKLSG